MEAAISAEYAKALEESRAASAIFREAQLAYRSRKIGDAEFLAARKIYDASEAAFDAAYAAEDAKAEQKPSIGFPDETYIFNLPSHCSDEDF